MRVTINQNISLDAPKSLTGTTRVEILRSRSKNGSLGNTDKGRLRAQSNETSSRNSSMCITVLIFPSTESSFTIATSQAPAFAGLQPRPAPRSHRARASHRPRLHTPPTSVSRTRAVTLTQSSLAPGPLAPQEYWLNGLIETLTI